MLDELKKENNTIDSKKRTCAILDRTFFDLSAFKKSLDFASNIYRKGKISLEDANKSQYKMFSLLNDLEMYDPKNLVKIRSKEELLINAENFYNNTDIIKTFKDEIFPFEDEFQKKESDMSDKPLPNWTRVDKKRFDKIRKTKFKML